MTKGVETEKRKQYKVIRSLNTGAFAQVDLARNVENQELVALKKISKENVVETDEKDHPKVEIAIHKRLKHPNIVGFKDSFETESDYVLVMEYGGSMDLFDYLHRKKELCDQECKELFIQIFNAVEYCHEQGVYHRDIKPENILVNGKILQLCDFGLATTDRISRDFGYGSVSYMAPEVFGDYKLIDGYFSSSADIWALGMLLFKMKFGVLPWKEASKSDEYFQSFLQNKHQFQKSFNLSDELAELLNSVFDINPFTRCSLKKFRLQFENLKTFCKQKDESKRRLSMAHRNVKGGKIGGPLFVKSWAEDDGEMDFTKPLVFRDGPNSLPISCGMSAHYKRHNAASNYVNVINVQ